MISPTTLLGIDPGYDRVGWCVLNSSGGADFQVIQFGSIETNKKQSLTERYQYIDQELQKIVDEYHPTEAALESLFFFKNETTALHVSEARGVMISTFFRNGVAIFEYTPLQVKQSVTGYGRAEKSAV